MSRIREQGTGKLVPLEGLRGIAAVIVMLGHMVRGLVPPAPGNLDSLKNVHDWMLNGGAAVSVFFVLSGFILSLPFAKDRSLLRVGTALLKRWPRLAALTTIACLFSWGLIELSHGAYHQAAAVTGNEWMGNHFNAPLHGHDISWLSALRDGLYRVYLFGDVKFDSPLWTMRIELFGSFAIFLAAPVLFGLKSWMLRLTAIAVAVALAGTTFPFTYFSDFLAGTLLAMLFAEGKLPAISNGLAAGMGLAGVYLFCFSAAEERAIYAPLKAVAAGELAHFAWAASAALIIIVLLGNAAMRGFFSKSWAAWLGLISFPIYLLHVPIMLSAGALSINGMADSLGVTGAVLAASCITIALTLAFALPLAWFDKAWTRILSRVAGWLTKRRLTPVGGGNKTADQLR